MDTVVLTLNILTKQKFYETLKNVIYATAEFHRMYFLMRIKIE